MSSSSSSSSSASVSVRTYVTDSVMYDDITSSSSSSCTTDTSAASSISIDVADALESCNGTAGTGRSRDLPTQCGEVRARVGPQAPKEALFLALFPLQLQCGMGDSNFCRIARISQVEYVYWKKEVLRFKYEKITHDAVWFTTASGRRFAVHPKTWVLRQTKASYERQLRRLAELNLAEELPPGYGGVRPVPILWYWDASARLIVCFRITMLIAWSPLMLKHPGALHGLLPVLIHAGPMPAGIPARPARPAVPAQPARAARPAVPARKATATSPARPRIPAVRARKAVPAQPRRPAREAVPDVRGTVHSLAAAALHDLEGTMTVPQQCIPRNLREALPDGNVLVELVNVSDLKSVGESTPDVSGAAVAFPADIRDPSFDGFRNCLGVKTSAGCHCTHAEQLVAGEACIRGRRGSIRFFVSPVGAWPPVTCRHMYLRHAQTHGVPAAACDVCQMVEKRGRSLRDSRLLALSRRMRNLFRSPFDPLLHLCGAERACDAAEARVRAPTTSAAVLDVMHDQAEVLDRALADQRLEEEERDRKEPAAAAGGAAAAAAAAAAAEKSQHAYRPDHTARLACVSSALEPNRRRLRTMAGRPLLNDIVRDLKKHGPQLQFDVRDAHDTILRVREAGDFFGDVVQLARTCHHPDAYLGQASPSDCKALEASSMRLMVDHKALCADVWPWRAKSTSGWYMRLLRNNQMEYKRAIDDIRFVANATAFSPGPHEFYVAVTRPVVLYGPQAASKMHEEAAEHLLLYWWLLVWVMGSRFADMDVKMDEAVSILACAHEALFVPVSAGLQAEAINKYYKVSQRTGNEAEWAGQIGPSASASAPAAARASSTSTL